MKDRLRMLGEFSLVFLFVYTAASKLLAFDRFRLALWQSPFIGRFSGLIAYALPAAELTIAILIIIPSTKRIGLLVSLWLLIVMTLYLIAMILFAGNLPCACGGVIEKLGWKGHIVFNIIFIMLNRGVLHKNRA
jgi:hypothetical protein